MADWVHINLLTELTQPFEGCVSSVNKTVEAFGKLDAMVETVPVKRLGHPEEIAGAVLWLCSDMASFVVGHTLVVDGGYSIQ